MTSTSPAPRPFLGALALVSVLGLAACSGGPREQPGTAGAAPEATTGTSAEATSADAPAAPSATGQPDEPAGSPEGQASSTPPAEETGAAVPAPEVGTADAAGGSRWCTAAQLEIAAAPVGGAAGSVWVDLTATNTGASACTIGGYPGVSFVDASGTMIGVPAVRDATAPGSDHLVAPGESVSAALRVSQAGNHPACDARSATGLRVYPPESTQSVVVPLPAQACAGPQIQQLEVQGFGT